MRIALIQSNPLVGDLRGNAAALLRDARQAAAAGAQLALAPELALWGYPPRDLLLHGRRKAGERAAVRLQRLCRRGEDAGGEALLGAADMSGGGVARACSLRSTSSASSG